MTTLSIFTLFILLSSQLAYSLDNSLVEAVQVVETGLVAAENPELKVCNDEYQWVFENIRGSSKIVCKKLSYTNRSPSITVNEALCPKPKYNWGEYNISLGASQIRCLKLTPKGELIDAVENEALCPNPKYNWGEYNISLGASQIRCLKLTPKGELIDAVENEKLCPQPKYNWGEMTIDAGRSQIRCLKQSPKGQIIKAVSDKLCNGIPKL